jgi:hypothetical protein
MFSTFMRIHARDHVKSRDHEKRSMSVRLNRYRFGAKAPTVSAAAAANMGFS